MIVLSFKVRNCEAAGFELNGNSFPIAGLWIADGLVAIFYPENHTLLQNIAFQLLKL